jgi:hypothetical protein
MAAWRKQHVAALTSNIEARAEFAFRITWPLWRPTEIYMTTASTREDLDGTGQRAILSFKLVQGVVAAVAGVYIENPDA